MNYEDLIRHQEGYEKLPYLDTRGNMTIGIGHFLGKAGFCKKDCQKYGLSPSYFKTGLTSDQVEEIFKDDLVNAVNRVSFYFPSFQSLDEVRQAVLINMCFNMGILRLLKFDKTLGFIKQSNFKKAADEMLKSEWAKQVPGRVKLLAEMMMTGVWPSE